jgi:hypothetical protein
MIGVPCNLAGTGKGRKHFTRDVLAPRVNATPLSGARSYFGCARAEKGKRAGSTARAVYCFDLLVSASVGPGF